MAIVLETLSDSKAAQDDLSKLRQSVEGIKNSADQVKSSFASFAKALAVSGAAFAAFKSYTAISDSLTNMESKLKVATNSSKEFSYALKQVQSIAINTRSDLKSVADLYSRISMSSKQLGANQRDVARFTSTVSKALLVSGAGVQEANAAVMQLGQALASGKLSGDELRSVLENAPTLALSLAEAMKTSVGKLREMGEQGQLTSAKIFRAVLSQQDQINAKFEKMGVTYGSAFNNLGTAFTILFKNASDAFLGSSNSLATGINNLAKGIFNFAFDFKLNMSIAKLALLTFVADGIILFQDFYSAVEETGGKIVEIAKEFYVAWEPALKKLLGDLQTWATAGVAITMKFGAVLIDRIKSISIVAVLLKDLEAFGVKAKAAFDKAFAFIAASLPTIDVMKIFPGLQTALNIVKSWAVSVERWFFWVYDRVIGHSWIPDLVEGVLSWTKKLLGSPLKNIADFASKSSGLFKNIRFASEFSAAIMLGSKLRTVLAPVLLIAGGIAAALMTIGYFKTKELKIRTDTTESATQSKGFLEEIPSLFKTYVVEPLKTIFKSLIDQFNTSALGRTIKQVLGLRDTTPGSIFGERIDTEAEVGRGPQRKEESRPLGHDIINALPSGWQIPIIAGVTAMIGLAIVQVTQAGPFRNILLSVLTTGAGIFAARNVHDKTISKTFTDMAVSFLSIVEKGISGLVDGNVMKDPAGFLSILAKSSLLFEGGREMAWNAATSVARAPTTLAQNMFSAGEARVANRRAAQLTNEITRLPQRMGAAVTSATAAYQTSVRTLSRLTDQQGNLIGMQRALGAVRGNNANALGYGNADELRRAQMQYTQAQQARNALTNVGATTAQLTRTRDDLRTYSQRLTEQVQASRQAFVDGTRNIGAGVGGILGGVAGFQIGVSIARGMEGYSGWAKIGAIVFSTVALQAVGSTIGLAIAQILLLAGSGIVAIVTSPLFLVGAAIAAVIAAALNPELVVKAFDYFKNIWSTTVIPAFDKFVKDLKDIIPKVQKGLREITGVDEPAVDAVPSVKKGDAVIAGAAVTVGAWMATKLGLFQGLIATARTGLASNLVGLTMMWQNFVASARAAMPAGGAGFIGPLFTGLYVAIGAVFTIGAVKVVIVAAVVALVGWLLYKLKEAIFGTSIPVQNEPARAPGQPGPEAIPRASGGWISGPGTGTSDSIPALLSNGEYVINAKSASKHRGLIEAINSGTVSKFATGGVVQAFSGGGSPTPAGSAAGAMPVVVKNAQEISGGTDKNLMQGLSDFMSRIKGSTAGLPDKILGMLDPGSVKTPTVVTPKTPRAAPTLLSRMESMKSMDQSAGLMQQSLTSSGFKVSTDTLKDRSSSTLQTVASALDSISSAQARIAKLPDGSFVKKQLIEAVDDAKRNIADTLTSSGAEFTAPSDLKEGSTSKKPTEMAFGDQFNIISKIFPELELSLKEFRALPDDMRAGLFLPALDLSRSLDGIDKKVIGFLESGRPLTPDVTQQFKDIEDTRRAQLATATGTLAPVRTPFKSVKSDFDKVGVSLTEEVYNSFSNAERGAIRALQARAEESIKILDKGAAEIPDDLRRAAQLQFGDAVKGITEMIQDVAVSSVSKSSAALKGINKSGVNLDALTFNLLTDLQQTAVEEYAASIKRNRDRLEKEDLSEEERKRIAKEIRVAETKVARIAKSTTAGEDAGKAFASTIDENLKTSLSGLLKGEKTLKETIKGVLDSFTSSVIDSFVQGLLNPFTGEGGVIDKAMKGLGTDLFNTSSGGSDATGDKSSGGIGGMLSSAWGGIKGLFGTKESSTTKPTGILSEGLSAMPTGILSGDLSAASEGLFGDVGLFGGFAAKDPAAAAMGSCDPCGGFQKTSEQITTAITDGTETQRSLFSSIGDVFSQGLEGLGGMLSSAWDGLKGLFSGGGGGGLDLGGMASMFMSFFAEGGHVTGPGTGTSDSIPAMLSNGEFVINAKSTKKFRPLLHALNAGKLPAFAAGGLVGATILTTPAMASVDNTTTTSAPTQQVFNISITGDISRQTRAEIHRMLPNIASGVNAYNREKQ